MASGDLLVITPTRGRPGNAARLLQVVHKTSRLDTHVYLGVDDDDPCLDEYKEMFAEHGHDGDVLEIQPRMGLSEWTNHIAVKNVSEYPFLASLGDDMVPQTYGWDRALVRVITDMGGTGFAYPWDGIREDVPECVIVSSDIVGVLGWMALPVCHHFWIDDAWSELGRAAACIRNCRAVKVMHMHPVTGKASGDATYRQAGSKIEMDRAAFFAWRKTQMPHDAAKIIALRNGKIKVAD